MPWCPKCRTEYRAGFTKCADCGSELVVEQPVEEAKIPAWLEGMPEDYVRAALSENGEGEVPSQAQLEAMKEQEQEQKEESKTPPRRSMGRAVYQDSKTKANENSSAGWMLLSLGIIGLIVLVLGFFEIIPIGISTSYFFYGVMAVMFLIFIFSGIVSLKNAKTFTAQAESENSVRNTLIEWCKENLKAEEIDQITQSQNDPEEIQYFKRISYLKFILNKQYVNLDQAFLDNFIDEYLYDSIFEAEE